MLFRSVMFSTVLSERIRFGIFQMVPSSERSRVLRKPTASTIPSEPLQMIRSPTLKVRSEMSDMAPKRFAMVFWAAKAMASPATPAPVIRAVTFRLKRFCAMKMTAIVQTAAFTLRRIRSESSLLSLWSSLSRFCRT